MGQPRAAGVALQDLSREDSWARTRGGPCQQWLEGGREGHRDLTPAPDSSQPAPEEQEQDEASALPGLSLPQEDGSALGPQAESLLKSSPWQLLPDKAREALPGLKSRGLSQGKESKEWKDLLKAPGPSVLPPGP